MQTIYPDWDISMDLTLFIGIQMIIVFLIAVIISISKDNIREKHYRQSKYKEKSSEVFITY